MWPAAAADPEGLAEQEEKVKTPGEPAPVVGLELDLLGALQEEPAPKPRIFPVVQELAVESAEAVPGGTARWAGPGGAERSGSVSR